MAVVLGVGGGGSCVCGAKKVRFAAVSFFLLQLAGMLALGVAPLMGFAMVSELSVAALSLVVGLEVSSAAALVAAPASGNGVLMHLSRYRLPVYHVSALTCFTILPFGPISRPSCFNISLFASRSLKV